MSCFVSKQGNNYSLQEEARRMKLRELIFSQPQWTSRTLWDSIQTELGGRMIYIPKVNVKDTQFRDEKIRDLFYTKNKSVRQLTEEFGLCKMRVWQIIKSKQNNE